MWEIFKDAIFYIIQFFYNFCGDWGLAIIIVTLIFRAVITPLIYSQSKSTYQTQKMKPEMDKIKERFPDDPVRQNEETQKLYAEAKYNPVMGCIPMLIQLPIFMALFQVLRELDKYIPTGAENYCFYNIVPNLVYTPGDALGIGIGTFVPYFILLLIFALATFLPMMFQPGQDPKQKNTMMIMGSVMTLMMLWIGWSSPAGVLLFWGASSLLAILQSRLSLRIIKKKDEKAEAEKAAIAKPVEVDVVRKPKKKRQSKKR